MKQINARIWRDRDILGLVAGITAIGIFIGVCLYCVVLLISHAEADEMVCTSAPLVAGSSCVATAGSGTGTSTCSTWQTLRAKGGSA